MAGESFLHVLRCLIRNCSEKNKRSKMGRDMVYGQKNKYGSVLSLWINLNVWVAQATWG